MAWAQVLIPADILMQNNTPQPTQQVLDLIGALKKRGINAEHEYSDGHKHVDIFIPDAKIYIEVDGLQHFTNPKRIISDFKRDHYSDTEGIPTLRITNQLVETHLDEIADAIAEVTRERLNK